MNFLKEFGLLKITTMQATNFTGFRVKIVDSFNNSFIIIPYDHRSHTAVECALNYFNSYLEGNWFVGSAFFSGVYFIIYDFDYMPEGILS